MRKIKAIIETGFAGCIHEGEFEVSDWETDEEINRMVDDWVSNYIFVNWWEEK